MATMEEARALAQQYNLGSINFENIRAKAEAGTAMQSPNAQKQAVYDAIQSHYKTLVTQKAQSGAALTRPNEWKNEIYNQAIQSQQTPTTLPGGLMSVEQYLQQAQTDSTARLQSLQQWYEQSAQNQLTSQQGQLALSRDQQLAELDMALKQAISQGQMSIREAEQQFEKAKGQIYAQAYTDSELTNLTAHDRGIQNSSMMIGLMQGDTSRRNTLLNDNLTTRDNQINAINNQLAQMEYSTNVNKALANSQYNYGLASAQGDIYAKMYEALGNMNFQEGQRLSDNQFALQQMGLSQQFDLDKLTYQQKLTLQQMAQQQNYQQLNMNKEQEFRLEQMSVDQRYKLEQMAKQFGYDLDRMSVEQQYALAQMAQSFGYDLQLQNNSQSWQSSENALNRNLDRELLAIKNQHDFNLLDKESQVQMDQYYTELSRKLAQYTPGTDEYKLLQSEADWAFKMASMESQATFAAEIGATELANLLEQYPKSLPNTSDKKAVEEYNSKIEYINKQLQKLLGSQEAQKYMRDLAKSKGKSESQSTNFIKTMTEVMGTSIQNIIKFSTP